MKRLLAYFGFALLALGVPTALAQDFGGKPNTRVTAVAPEIELAADPSGAAPLVVHASAGKTTATGTDNAFADLEYSWDFGTDGRVVRDPVSGTDVKSGRTQRGPLAAMIFDEPGTYTVTLTARYWDGTAVRAVQKAKSVTVKSFVGDTRAFENGQTFDAVLNWVTAGPNRQAVLRRGVTYPQNGGNKAWVGGTNQRIVADNDATGPLPVVQARYAGELHMIMAQQIKGKKEFCGVQFRNIAFDGNGVATTAWFAYPDSRGEGTHPNADFVHFIGCKFTGFKHMCLVPQPGEKGNYGGLWGCTLDEGQIKLRSHAFVNYGRGFISVANVWVNGIASDKTLDHMLYPNVRKDLLVRWNQFGPGEKSYGVNANGPYDEKGYPRYTDILIADNLITGVQHGIDLGNHLNDPSKGTLDRVVIQRNTFDLKKKEGWNGPVAVSFANGERITVRDNLLGPGVVTEMTEWGKKPQMAQITGYRNAGAKTAWMTAGTMFAPYASAVPVPVPTPSPVPTPIPVPIPVPTPVPVPVPTPLPVPTPAPAVVTITGKDEKGNDVTITIRTQPK